MEKKIGRLFFIDCTVLLFSLVAIWAMVIFTMTEVSEIAPSKIVQNLLDGSALLVCFFATASLAAVYGHIKRNRNAIYREDILVARDKK